MANRRRAINLYKYVLYKGGEELFRVKADSIGEADSLFLGATGIDAVKRCDIGRFIEFDYKADEDRQGE